MSDMGKSMLARSFFSKIVDQVKADTYRLTLQERRKAKKKKKNENRRSLYSDQLI